MIRDYHAGPGSPDPQHFVIVGYFSMFLILEQTSPKILSKTFGIPPFLRHVGAACQSRRESQRSFASRIFTTSTPPSRLGNLCFHLLVAAIILGTSVKVGHSGTNEFIPPCMVPVWYNIYRQRQWRPLTTTYINLSMNHLQSLVFSISY
jgi:hypothetical protein